MDPFNESEILTRAREFEMRALADIYDHFSPAIYFYSQRMLNSSFLAEECVAETFSRLLHAFKKGMGPKDNLRAYLYRIAHNWITDFYRKRQPDQPGDEELEKMEDSSDLIGETEMLHTRQQVRRILNKLPEQQRQIIHLRYFEGWELDEIATCLNRSVNYVKVNQHRAVNALRREFEKRKS
jgi:RNA polymerase sigma-70 factor (ECF subfamily)